MIKATKIIHKEQFRIKVDLPYNRECTARIRQIEDAKWSATHRAWHIPYTKQAFGKLKILFPDVEVETTDENIARKNMPRETVSIAKPDTMPPYASMSGAEEPDLPKITSILIEVIGRKIILKMPKSELDVKFVLTFRYARWDKTNRLWIVPNYPNNLELMKEYFKDRISQVILHKEVEIKTGESSRQIASTDVVVVKTKAGRLRLIFGFNKALTAAIKKNAFLELG